MKNAKGEVYIETALTLLISVFILTFSVSVYNLYSAYHKLDYMAGQLMHTATMVGNVKSNDVYIAYRKLCIETGLGDQTDSSNHTTKGYADSTNMHISFDGSDLAPNPNPNGAVQLGHEIKLTLRVDMGIRSFSTHTIVPIPITVIKTSTSEHYWFGNT